MNKRSVLQGIFIALLCLPMANSYGQLNVLLGLPVDGTASAAWDVVQNRYLYTYQKISIDIMGTPIFNEAAVYYCSVNNSYKNEFTTCGGQLRAPTKVLIKGDTVFIADWSRIWLVDIVYGTVIDQIMAPKGEGIQDITSDGVNTLFATDILDSVIYSFDMTTKAYTKLASGKDGLILPSGIYYEETPKKSLFVCSFRQNSPIQRYDFSGDSLYIVKRTTYRYCYGITGDGKGNYYLSDWKSLALNAGTVYKFIGGWDLSYHYVDYLNYPAIPCYGPETDTLVITELNKSLNPNTVRMVFASRDVIPPIVDNAVVANDKTIVVYFNEPVNVTAKDTIRYGGVGSIASVSLNITKMEATVSLKKALKLNFATPFSVSNVQDLAGNSMYPAYTTSLTYKIQSIYDSYLKDGLTVYPNPVKNKLNINYELLQSAPVSIELFDILGKRVADFYNGNQNPGNYELNYQLPNSITNNGLYILKFTVDGQIFMSKILVNR